MPGLLATVLAGMTGGIVFSRLRVPTGAMVGAMLCASVCGLLMGHGDLPDQSRIVLQMFSGILAGSSLTWQEVQGMKKMAWPLVIMIAAMVVFNLVLGGMLALFGGVDLATGLFSVTPGGAADMALLADELGANPMQVAVLQSLRLVVIVLTVVPLSRRYITAQNRCAADSERSTSGTKPAEVQPAPARGALGMIGTLCCGAAAGFVVWKTGVAAGALLGGMLGSAAWNLLTGKGYMPSAARVVLQCAAGTYVGAQLTVEALQQLRQLIVPVLLIPVGVFFYCVVTANLLHKFTGLDRPTCILISSPGGIQEMSLLAADLGVHPAQVALMHSARAILVIALFPTILSALVRLIG